MKFGQEHVVLYLAGLLVHSHYLALEEQFEWVTILIESSITSQLRCGAGEFFES